MAKYKSEELLAELKKDVQRIADAAKFFAESDPNKLVYSSDKGSWSIVQILEHLNAYNRHYLPLIEKEVSLITYDNDAWFTSGYWGEKFTRMMKPGNVFEVKNKMKASKAYSFPNSLNVEAVLKEFQAGQQKMLDLLDRATGKDLGKIHIPITLTKLIKLRLGDTFRFLIAHEQRHMIQARNTLKAMGQTTEKFPVILEVTPQ